MFFFSSFLFSSVHDGYADDTLSVTECITYHELRSRRSQTSIALFLRSFEIFGAVAVLLA